MDHWFIITHRDRRRNAKISDESSTENDHRQRTEEAETPQRGKESVLDKHRRRGYDKEGKGIARREELLARPVE